MKVRVILKRGMEDETDISEYAGVYNIINNTESILFFESDSEVTTKHLLKLKKDGMSWKRSGQATTDTSFLLNKKVRADFYTAYGKINMEILTEKFIIKRKSQEGIKLPVIFLSYKILQSGRIIEDCNVEIKLEPISLLCP